MAAKMKGLVDLARPKLDVFMKYAKVELIPPSPVDIPKIMEGVKNLIKGANSGAWKCVTVQEATVNGLVTLEVILWFYMGEVVGKRHFVGYNV